MVVLSHQGQPLSGTEIQFLSRDEADYPQLTRLCLDFDFRVLSVSSNCVDDYTQYLISNRHYRDQGLIPITPLFDSLAELERYTDENIINILDDSLVEDKEDSA